MVVDSDKLFKSHSFCTQLYMHMYNLAHIKLLKYSLKQICYREHASIKRYQEKAEEQQETSRWYLELWFQYY